MRFLKLLSMAVGILLAWYFAGPIVAEVARGAFEVFYLWQYGYIPSYWSLEYYFTFMPMRGHVTYYAYLYGNKICAFFAAPLFYKLPDIIASCLKSDEPEMDYSRYEHQTQSSLEEEDYLEEPYPSFLVSHKMNPSIDKQAIKDPYPGYRLR
ncbi:MAG: hypothetical protein AB7I18_11490 [Candidatus Berkiella sp.]